MFSSGGYKSDLTRHLKTMREDNHLTKFGCDLARSLIADTLLTNFKANDFVDLVQPLTPHKVKNRVWTDDMLSELVNTKMLGKLITSKTRSVSYTHLTLPTKA